MPSTSKLLFDLTLTAGLVFGGAWLAAHLSSPAGAAAEAPGPKHMQSESLREDNHLIVEITGVREGEGNVIVLVFDDEAAYQTYDYERAVGYQEIRAEAQTMKASFTSLRTGPYAVALFHDENGDYDFNMAGSVPAEGYGTSGASGPYDEPRFEDATVGAGSVRVQMYYLN